MLFHYQFLLYCEQLTFFMRLLKHEKTQVCLDKPSRLLHEPCLVLTAPPSCFCTCKQIFFINCYIKIILPQNCNSFVFFPLLNLFTCSVCISCYSKERISHVYERRKVVTNATVCLDKLVCLVCLRLNKHAVHGSSQIVVSLFQTLEN